MERKWTEVAPLGPQDHGDVGGDAQASDSWGRRFVLPRDEEGLVPVLEVRYFIARKDHLNEGGPRCVRRQVEYMLCTDPYDPGSTEVWSDQAEQDLIGPAAEPTSEDARRMCAEMPPPGLGDWTGAREHGEAVLRRIVLAEARKARA